MQLLKSIVFLALFMGHRSTQSCAEAFTVTSNSREFSATTTTFCSKLTPCRRPCSHHQFIGRFRGPSPILLKATENSEDALFDARTTLAVLGGQSVLIIIAVAIAAAIGTPNFGLGPNIDFGARSLTQGAFMALPLGITAYALDAVEKNVPALQDVTKATQRSVLTLLGGTFKPIVGLTTAVGLGVAAGLGEEMLFRGVLQYEMGVHAGDLIAIALTSLVFGALHAVTPIYALLASLASVYFGYLYTSSGNLAVPISTHTVYDVIAIFYAHWTVSVMSDAEQVELMNWDAPFDRRGN